jgi:PPOX class probable F420-dependent enzyme
MALDPRDPELRRFWAERHLCTLTTLRADGSPHVVAVGVTFDPDQLLARVITSGSSQKARNVDRAATGTALVAACQVDGRRWSTLEGTARLSRDPDEVAEAVERYSQRYRQPRVNPARVVLLIDVTRVLGSVTQHSSPSSGTVPSR